MPLNAKLRRRFQRPSAAAIRAKGQSPRTYGLALAFRRSASARVSVPAGEGFSIQGVLELRDGVHGLPVARVDHEGDAAPDQFAGERPG